MRASRFLLFTATLASLQALVLAASADDWRNRSIYQVVTDRFAVSDNSSPSCPTEERKYCGGTWKGITNHLDYIQALGFDAVYPSPIVANIEGTTPYGEAYHGYWPQDIFALNPHFGTESDLVELITEVHKRGMYFMLDVVVNHVGATQVPPQLSYHDYVPFNQSSDYHPLCWITDYTNQTQVEQCWLGDTNVALADVATHRLDVRETYNNWIREVVQKYNIDGLRLDTVKHVEKDFFKGFGDAAGVFTFGEVLDGRVEYVAGYQDVIDSAYNYPVYYALTAAFNTTSSGTGDMRVLARAIANVNSTFKDPTVLGVFIENQDVARFQSLIKDEVLVQNAQTFTFVGDGIPLLYYGQEASYAGGADPANREAFWTAAYETEKPLAQLALRLNQARKAAIASSSSFLTTRQRILNSTSTHLALSKYPLTTLLSSVGSSAASHTQTITGAPYKPNEALVEIVSCTPTSADAEGNVQVTVSGGLPLVWIPEDLVEGTGICSGSASGMRMTSAGVRVAAEVRWVAWMGLAAAGLAMLSH